MTKPARYVLAGAALTGAALAFRPGVFSALTESKTFLPHITCYLRDPRLVWVNATTGMAIGLSYVAISTLLALLVHRGRKDIPFSWIFLAFGSFIVACGATHFMEVLTLWRATYWLSATVKIVTAVASVATALVLPPLIPKALRLVSDAKKSRERLAALEQERVARVEAEEASRSKDAFLATLSHELRTPMTAILGWSTMMRDGRHDEEKVRTAMQSIERCAKQQAQLIDDLLDVSRIVAGKLAIEMRPVDVASTVRAAVESLQPSAEKKGVRVEIALPPQPLIISGDHSRLQQVICNLLSNAIKFTPAGGRVRIEARREARDVTISVTDTGVGIASDFLPIAFDRFTQADASTTRGYGGLGLGLAIVRHLVELHGGQVSAESDGEWKGARFTVRLPHSPRAEVAAAVSPVALPQLNGVRILLVEDEPLAREMLHAALASFGARVEATASVRDAMTAASASTFDAVVTDIAMPGEDGISLLKRMRERSRIPIIAVSALSRGGAEFDDFLQKPVEPAALGHAVARLTTSRDSS